jgi:arylsulfatase A-like enzyme
MVLWGSGIRAGEYTRPVRTVDIAPTLARLLGVRPTERLDGVSLREVQ